MSYNMIKCPYILFYILPMCSLLDNKVIESVCFLHIALHSLSISGATIQPHRITAMQGRNFKKQHSDYL